MLTLFTTVYMLAGLIIGISLLVDRQTEIEMIMSLEQVPEAERKIVLMAGLVLFVLGWPLMLFEIKNKL